MYKRFRQNGDNELRTEYCKLCKEVKQLIMEKKLDMWNNVVEKANVIALSDYICFLEVL